MFALCPPNIPGGPAYNLPHSELLLCAIDKMSIVILRQDRYSHGWVFICSLHVFHHMIWLSNSQWVFCVLISKNISPQDLPDGNFADLKKSGDKLKVKGYAEFFVALRCVPHLGPSCAAPQISLWLVYMLYIPEFLDLQRELQSLLICRTIDSTGRFLLVMKLSCKFWKRWNLRSTARIIGCKKGILGFIMLQHALMLMAAV